MSKHQDQIIAAANGKVEEQIRSILDPEILTTLAGGGRIELTHVNVADSDFAGVSEGWSKYYWTPWRAYLTRTSRKPVDSG